MRTDLLRIADTFHSIDIEGWDSYLLSNFNRQIDTAHSGPKVSKWNVYFQLSWCGKDCFPQQNSKPFLWNATQWQFIGRQEKGLSIYPKDGLIGQSVSQSFWPTKRGRPPRRTSKEAAFSSLVQFSGPLSQQSPKLAFFLKICRREVINSIQR